MLDVAIIGSGVIGAAIARELARLELQIAVFDRNEDVSEGTTKSNSAIVHAGFDAPPGSLKARYNVAGSRIFEAWCRELGSPYRRNTSLVIAFNEADESTLRVLLERGRQNGVEGLRLIDRAELLQREPRLNPAVTMALLAETGAICSPYEMAIRLCEQAAANGVTFRLGCRVERVRRVGPDMSGSAEPDGVLEPGAAVGSGMPHYILETSAGRFAARTVVNAAGVYADDFNNQVSADRFTIHACRGEYWLLDRAAGPAMQATVFQAPTPMGKGVLVTPTVEDTLIIGPTAQDIDDKDDTRTTAAGLEQALQVARRTWPDLPSRMCITTFAGLRARSDRHDFIIGEAADAPGFFNAAGIESPGLTAAPAIALELAAAVARRLAARPRQSLLPVPERPPQLRDLSPEARAAAAAADPSFGHVICRCETISEAEIRAAIRRAPGARTLDAVKRRTRAGMGRCQGGFCMPRVLAILAEELGVPETAITKFGRGSQVLSGTLQAAQQAQVLAQAQTLAQAPAGTLEARFEPAASNAGREGGAAC